MDDLVTWLRGQLDEDERIARAAHAGPWRAAPAMDSVYEEETAVVRLPGPLPEAWSAYVVAPDSEGGEGIAPADADHIARHDPARVLAEVDAKRRILDLHSGPDPSCDECEHLQPCRTVRLLALPYADRPGYRQEWAPSASA